jgi:hypothetical protein
VGCDVEKVYLGQAGDIETYNAAVGGSTDALSQEQKG